MAIEKRFIHFKKFSDFNSKKLSANEANTQYTIGISGEIQTGSPDVLYQSYVWIKDTQQQWTHGQIYNGGLVNETDPIFSVSPAANITEDQIIKWDNTHEFVQNIDEDISQLYNDLSDKQDIISDLTTIRNNASKGATAVQPSSLAAVATSGSYNDLVNKPTIPSAVTESTVSGWGFTKNTGTYSKPSTGIPKSDLNPSVQTSLEKADTAVQPEDIKDEVYIADFTMESLKRGWRYGTQVDCDMQGLVSAMNANKIILVRESDDSGYKGVHILNGYAEDLLHFSIVDTMGEILWCDGTAYIGGIQSIDGASLHLQLWEDKQDVLVSGDNIKTINGNSIMGSGNIEIGGGGTITEIKANGTSIATSGIANIPAASTSVYGVTKLTSSTSSTSTTLAATASAVKAACDLAKSFVPMTLSTYTTSFGTSLRWSPNKKYASTAALSNNVTFDIDVSSIDATKDNTWALSFILDTSAHAISFTVSQTGYTIMWANGVAPTFEPNTAYEITFKLVGTNLFGVCGAFKTV